VHACGTVSAFAWQAACKSLLSQSCSTHSSLVCMGMHAVRSGAGGKSHFFALGYSVCDPPLCDMIWYDLGYAVARGEQAGQGGCCPNAPRCGSERFFAERGNLQQQWFSLVTNIALPQEKKTAVNVAKDQPTRDAFEARRPQVRV
jgi:hypothetical protein